MWTKNRVAASPNETRHMARLKQMPCICCRLLLRQQSRGTDCHHIRAQGESRNHWLTLPVCWDCHQGQHGIHGDKRYLTMLKLSEWGLLAHVIADLDSLR